MNTEEFQAGGYRYIPGVFQYSAGVIAMPDLEIVRVRLRRPLPLVAGFERASQHLAAVGRPLTVFCACELRSPAPFSEAGFRSFNEIYVGILEHWGIFKEGRNPVARTNVCPEVAPPSEPSLYAFSYTRPRSLDGASFVVAGSGEVPEGRANYRDHIVRPGDTSADGLREKARYVIGAMASRLSGLGVGWAGTTATQIYTVHDIHPLVEDELVPTGAAPFGLTWHFTRPPVAGLDYEMDCRGTPVELVI